MSGQFSSTTVDAVMFLIDERALSVNEVSRRMDITPGRVKEIIARSQKPRARSSNVVVGVVRSAYRGDCLSHVDRDPCFRCGVRKDIHEEAGCPKWKAIP